MKNDEKKVVLAIDDNIVMLKILSDLLNPVYNVLTCVSAANAITMMDRVTPSLILLDIEMPDISGFEFLHTIRKNPKFMNIPVIIITSHDETGVHEHATKNGASSVVMKPVNPDELFQKIVYAFEHPPKGLFGL